MNPADHPKINYSNDSSQSLLELVDKTSDQVLRYHAMTVVVIAQKEYGFPTYEQAFESVFKPVYDSMSAYVSDARRVPRFDRICIAYGLMEIWVPSFLAKYPDVKNFAEHEIVVPFSVENRSYTRAEIAELPARLVENRFNEWADKYAIDDEKVGHARQVTSQRVQQLMQKLKGLWETELERARGHMTGNVDVAASIGGADISFQVDHMPEDAGAMPTGATITGFTASAPVLMQKPLRKTRMMVR